MLVCECFSVLTMMTDTPAVVLSCLGAVLKCVFSLPVTSIFMLFPMTASSYVQTCNEVEWLDGFPDTTNRLHVCMNHKSHMYGACKYRDVTAL